MYGAHVQWAQEMRWPQVTLASLFLSFFSFLLSFFLSFLLSFFLSSFALFLGSVRRCCERIHRVRLTVGARCLSHRRFLVRRCGVSESAAAAPRRETAVESRAKGGGRERRPRGRDSRLRSPRHPSTRPHPADGDFNALNATALASIGRNSRPL